jgi:hypothetical protein
MRVHRTAAAALLLLAAGVTAAQETIPNPEFTDWARFKKGTSVKMKISNTAAGMTTETVVTTTLVEVGADKVVVEMASTTRVNGMEFKAPPMKRDVPKTFALPAGAKKPDPKTAEKPPGTFEEGTETVKVAGAQYKAKWYRSKFEADGNKIESKTWMADDVPGKFLKSDTTVSGAVAATTKMELVEVKKP